jgi:hypothetical protein
MNKESNIVFMVERHEKSYELTLAEAIQKQLKYLFGKFSFKKLKINY